MKRIYHPYWTWEDWQAGMWGSVSKAEAAALLTKAVEFTGNATLYGSYMQRVIREWPIACEHNLTETSMNRQAWIGHAATAMALGGCPETITRQAWAHLTQEQQDAANEQAQQAIDQWVTWHEAKDR